MFDSVVRNTRSLFAQLREDRVAHYRDTSLPGFRAIAVYRFGVWAKTLPRPIGLPLLLFYEICYRWVRNHYGIQLYRSAKIGRRVCLANQGNIAIHRDTVIGDDCVIRQNVTIGGVSGARNFGPELGRQVEVGAGAVIIGKIRIGDQAKIGPNAVVSQNIPAKATVVAPPVKILLRADAAGGLDDPSRPDGLKYTLSERVG